MEFSSSKPTPINRVALACIQCRSRHVKCDATQPTCNRCRRDGKECTYMKSRRGGLDKATLARRRLALQQQAQRAQQTDENGDHQSSTGSSNSGEQEDHIAIPNIGSLDIMDSASPASNDIVFNFNTDRLIDLYYENFYRALPIVLPLHFLSQRQLNENHGLDALLIVMQWIGSIYAPWTPSDAYYEKAYQTLCEPSIPRNGFTVQAMMLFAIAQHHCDLKCASRKMLDCAISIALAIGMNLKEFARRYGEGNPVLEESWRRTYYLLHISDQHFSVVVRNPMFSLRDVTNYVDLPCDDEYYESGRIPAPVTWHEYEVREFADVEIIYSSIVYLYDVAKVISYIMRTFVETGSFGDTLVSNAETKLAIWKSLLPTCKRDPLRPNGTVDEVMFLAHEISAIITTTIHRPFSSLTYSIDELSTESFISPVTFVEPLRQGKSAHTARALKATEMQTKLLAIPCSIEHHNLFTMCIMACLCTAQIAACNILLEDRALSIARDRVRLSIGALNAFGNFWPHAKKMAREVRRVARGTLASAQSNHAAGIDSGAEIEVPRDDLIWPVNPSAQIDIYSGIVLPWDDSLNHSSSSSIML